MYRDTSSVDCAPRELTHVLPCTTIIIRVSHGVDFLFPLFKLKVVCKYSCLV